MKSKHMSSGTVAAAGNDIRGSLADFRGPLTFPRLGLLVIYDFVRSSFSAMFHCKNNKTARQNQTGNPKKERKKRERERAGRFVIDDLCESKAGQHHWPLRASDPSLWIRTSLMTADLWRCFTYRTYRGQTGAGGRGRWGWGGENEVFLTVWHNLYLSRIRTCFFTFQTGRIRPPEQWICGW